MKRPISLTQGLNAASILIKMLAGTACVFLATGFHANAAIIAYDGFSSTSYTTGASLSGQLYGGTGFESPGSGLWYGAGPVNVGTSSSALTYAGVASNDTGGTYTPSSGGRTYANLAAPLTGNNTYYISVMMKNTLVSGDYRAFELASGNGDTDRILQVGTNADNGDSGANWGMRVNNTQSGNSGVRLTSVTAESTVKTTVFAVIKLTYSTTAGTSSATLWIDPTNLGSEAASTNSVSIGGLNFADASNIRFAQYNYYSMSYWDEVRIGTSWADVTPVPEPSTYALLGMGALVVVLVYRRKESQLALAAKG